jgi:RNA polymerase subunit RPABC4/transcription elongation factor Spt4
MKSIAVHPTDEAQEALRSCRQILETEQRMRVLEQPAPAAASPVAVAGGTSVGASARRCPHCRAGVDAETRFCPSCGKKIEPGLCPKCRRPVGADQKYCPNDGAKLF